jgi:chaperone BCS1
MDFTSGRIISNAITSLLQEPINMLRSTTSALMWYTVDISGFRWSIEQDAVVEFFRHVPRSFNPIAVEDPCASHDYAKIPGKSIDAYVHKGTAIFLEYECVDNATNNDGTQLRLTMKLKTLYTKRNIENLKDLIKIMMKRSKEIESEKSKKRYKIIDNGCFTEVPARPNRTFNDVFLPQVQEDLIVSSVKKFCASRKWYQEHKIPYHFGIMLYGNPGTGKSSVVQAITNLIECDIMYVKTDRLAQTIQNPHWLTYGNKGRMRIVIIEDIDTSKMTRDRRVSNKELGIANTGSFVIQEEVSINSLLNVLDGFNSPENVIYIFTTNHLEKLDPALVRPGRIDLNVEIAYLNEETFGKFMQFHYGRKPDTTIKVRNQMTCAELQTRVMEGMSFDEICNYVKEENYGQTEEN